MFQVTQHIPFLARSSSPDVSARVSLQFVQFLRQFAQHTSTQTGTAFVNGSIQAAGGKKNKNMPRGRGTSNMHIHAFLPYIKGLLLGNLKVHSKQIQTLCITFHARQVHPKAVRRKTPFVNESNFVDKQVH